MNPKKGFQKFKDSDPVRIDDEESKGFGEVKDSRSAYDRVSAEEHFKKTGQSSTNQFATSGMGAREDHPEPTPDVPYDE